MNKAQALDIAITAMFREIMREDDGSPLPAPPWPGTPPEDPRQPTPQFDFDESTCEHAGLVINRSACPIHGPEAMGPAPTAEELDDITGETHDEANPLLAKAKRVREQRERLQRQGPLYAEELPMAGLVSPPSDEPPLVV